VITDALLNVLFGFVNTFVSSFPNWTDPATFLETTNYGTCNFTAGCEVGSAVKYIDSWIDGPLLVTSLQVLIPSFGVALLLRGLLFVYHLIPFKMT